MPAKNISRVMVIGAGSMGEGIAQVIAQAGISVQLVDIDNTSLNRSKSQIASNLTLLRQTGLISEDITTIMNRLEFRNISNTQEIHPLLDCIDFVIEAIPEILDLKREIFQSLSDSPTDIVQCSNTSSLTISEITQELKHPQRIVGLHFFFPAHIIPLVEIHSGQQTSPEAIAIARDLMIQIGKKPIIVRKEIPGFIVNRIQAAYNREITYLLDQGVATVEELDMAAKAGFGFRLACLGPLEIHDLNGLDVVMKAGAKTRQHICNDRSHSPSLIQKVEKGELGVKTGKGWYDYQGHSRQKIVDDTNKKLLRQLALFQDLEKRQDPTK